MSERRLLPEEDEREIGMHMLYRLSPDDHGGAAQEGTLREGFPEKGREKQWPCGSVESFRTSWAQSRRSCETVRPKGATPYLERDQESDPERD